MNKKQIHAILEGKELERNLPEVMAEMSSANYAYAGLSFAMEYFSFYESVVSQDRKLTGEQKQLLRMIATIVTENFGAGFDGSKREKAIVALDETRKQITAKMQVLTNYTDNFALYEYMINRLEPGFLGTVTEVEDDTAAREILQYIFMEKDNVVINTRIHQMLSQLPVRMSRGKFCDLVRAGFENYQGMDVTAVEDFVYRIESVAGLYEPEKAADLFANLQATYRKLTGTDWKELSADTFRKLQEELAAAEDFLVWNTDCYYGLMGLINFLYAFLLNMPYASSQAEEKINSLKYVLEQVSGRILADDYSDVPEQLAEEFVQTEGSLEPLVMTVQKAQAVLDEILPAVKKSAGEMMVGTHLSCLVRSSMLLQDSRFMELEQKGSRENAQREYLDKAADTLCEKLQNLLAAQPKLKNRAMMAAVLAELPVFFNSHNEVMDYVRSSLAGCHDLSEKISSIRLMKQIMEA